MLAFVKRVLSAIFGVSLILVAILAWKGALFPLLMLVIYLASMWECWAIVTGPDASWKKPLWVNALMLLVGVVYIGVSLQIASLMRFELAGGTEIILLTFTGVWAVDSAAMMVGKWLKGPALCSKISPNKTWSGSIGGFITAVIFVAIVGCFLKIPLVHVLAIGIIAGIFGQVGDLLESAFKRFYNVTDSGNGIPGHGGFLDRFDSFFLVVYMVFVYAWL